MQTTLSPLALVLGNLVPLIGVIAWDWNVASLVIFYWSENLVIGGITVLKMLYKHPVGGLFAGAFFAVHYGGFCAVHGLFALAIFGFEMDGVMDGLDWPLFLVFVELLIGVTRQVLSASPSGMDLGLRGTGREPHGLARDQLLLARRTSGANDSDAHVGSVQAHHRAAPRHPVWRLGRSRARLAIAGARHPRCPEDRPRLKAPPQGTWSAASTLG